MSAAPTANLTSVTVDGDGHLTVKVPSSASLRPSVENCPSGTTVSGTDSAGIITIGSGGGGHCEVVFGKPFAEAPACVISNNMWHPTPKSIYIYEDHFAIDQVPVWNTTTHDFTDQLDTMLTSEKISYVCIGIVK
ncbi:MAG TPA: hypothetical protein VFX30_14280 [bacterium]|nr:hypothetical protein [bacterium]